MHEGNTTVAEYISFARDDQNRMTLGHAYTNKAILKLTSAASAMAGEVGFEIESDMDKVKESADQITKNPFETSHADEIRKAAVILSNVLQNMQQANYPGLADEVGKVKSAAMAINPQKLTLDQRETFKTFLLKPQTFLKK